jgi:hypothetical protein
MNRLGLLADAARSAVKDPEREKRNQIQKIIGEP